MNDTYLAEFTNKFTALTLEGQVRQVKEWIETRPHNEEIIPLGKHCRAADYVDNLNLKYFGLLNRAYNDSYNQNQIAEFCSRLRDLALMDSIHNKNAAALPLSICFGSLAAYHLPLDDTGSMRGETISMFARTLCTQWQKTRTNELLDETIEYFRKAIVYGARDGKYRDVHFLDLGEQLRERYVMNHSPVDFEEASRCLESSVRVNPAGTPIISLSSANLKEEKNKFDGFGTLQVLNEYIDTLVEAVRVIPKDFNHFDYRQSLSSVYWHLGHALMRRFSLTKAKSDYQSAAGAFQDPKEAPQHGEGDKLWTCLGLGRLMLTEYDLNSRIETAEEAERRLKEALKVRPDSKDVMEWLGELYRLQALHTGSKTTLTDATRLLDRCVEGSDGPPKYFLLTKAAYAHAHLYELLGEKKNIDRAIELLFQARLDSTHSREDKLAGKCKLAHVLVLRFEHAEDEKDLDRALSIIEEAEKADLEGSAVSNCYRIHGVVLNARYQVRGVMTDLQLAIEYYQKAVTIPDAGADRYSAHNDLGNAFLSHYRATGDTQSLLKSAKTYDTALQSFRSSLWKDNKSTECMLLRGLGNTQFYQFETSQRLSDIDLAIACYQRCYDDTALDHVIRVSRAGSLAHALQKRFALTKQIEDAQKSQTVLLEVLNYGFPLTPRAVSDLHNDLGSAYLRCYVSSEQLFPLEYLDHAATHYQKALASGCKIPSYIRTATINLSTVYRHKASNTRKIQDILPAVKHFIQVLQNISFQERQDPQYEITLWNMAQLVFVYFDVAESRPIQGMLNIVMKFVPSFAQFKTLPRDWIVQTYMRLALLQFRVASQPAEALRLVQAAAEEIPGSILLRSLNRTEQLRVIRNLNNVPKMGIVFSLMAGESALSALKLFETSRSVLWDNILANKLDEQTSSMLHEFPELESRFETLRQALSKHENVDVVIDPSSVGVLRQGEQFGQATSYSQILDEIRSKPGLQDFLRLPRDSASLQKYTNEGPMIIVNGAPIRSDAIIIRTDGVFSVSLPLFTHSTYEKIKIKQTEALAEMGVDLEKSDRLLAEVLKDLWDVVAEPILDFLGY
ncbi:MAG: hypothetical protein M1821_007502 [Bathelium mastoideum]|nr:MAG: hypothetical protein M1821_007502 [Bathelium mastoideum]